MKKYKCIIFDLDGTMLNTEEMNMIPLQRLIKEELNKDISYNDLLKYKAYSGKKTLELLGFNDIEKSYSKWVKYVNEYENGAELYDGFKEVIETLDKNNILCGISSSKTRAQYEIDFFKTGLQKYMKSVILAEDTENHKPHPEPLLKVAETLEVSPKEVIYVGDTFADYNLNEPKDLLKVLGI